MNRDFSALTMSVCNKFQVNSSNTFGVMLWKPNLTFVFVTLKIKVMSPKWIEILRSLWGRYILGFNLTAVELFELLHGNDRDLKIESWPQYWARDPKIYRHRVWLYPSVCTRCQVDSFDTFGVMLKWPQNGPVMTFKLTAWPQKWA